MLNPLACTFCRGTGLVSPSGMTRPCPHCQRQRDTDYPPVERFAHRDVRRTYHAEPFTDAELNRTATTLRAPVARRKVTR